MRLLLLVVYFVIGVVVAASHHYFEHLGSVKADRIGGSGLGCSGLWFSSG